MLSEVNPLSGSISLVADRCDLPTMADDGHALGDKTNRQQYGGRENEKPEHAQRVVTGCCDPEEYEERKCEPDREQHD